MNGNWMECLLKTYDVCSADPATRAERVPLVPICHTLNNMHITVTIDEQGRFLSSEVIPKDRQNTIIPCTEESAGRTSGLQPHPLDDKLQYLAPDFYSYAVGEKERSGESPFEMYVSLMARWCESDFSNRKVAAVLSYVRGGTLIRDLVSSGALVTGEDGRLAAKKDRPDAPLFAEAKIAGEQHDAFIRWSVVVPGDCCSDTWDDPSLVDDWISFAKSVHTDAGLCYMTGDTVPLAKNHPSRIRNSGDMAKIMSSNDSSGFTFRGRFENSEQACGVGFEQSQKMHSALRWLIGRQGYSQGDFCMVSWTTSGDRVVSPPDDLSSQLDVGDSTRSAWTNAEAAKHLNGRLRGYNSSILDKEVMVMALDSAQSRQGRLAVTMFRHELGEDLVRNLEAWHDRCAWIHRYAKVRDEDGKDRRITFVGAPAPKDIAMAAYGLRSDEKLVATAVKRLLPCIMDGERIPRDIEESVVRRASNPLSMEDWEWRKTLSIACSVFKGYSGVGYEMVLEKERTSRDYLFGRLLAIADLMESSALRDANESRQTTAVRLMQRFSERPCSTWKSIELALVPYAARLGPKSNYYRARISEVMDLFEGDDFRDDSPLKGEFLLAYHCQIEDHYARKDEKTENNTEEE